MDEPINGLDPLGITEIRELITRINKEENITIMISSHILEELNKVATSFGIINHGKLVRELTENELRTESEEKIEIITDDTGLAVSILEKENISNFTVVDTNKIHVYQTATSVADLNRKLVTGGVNVEGIHAIGSSLENFYLSCVDNGGNKNA